MVKSEYTLSPSSLNLFAECPRCFWLKVNEGKSRPSGPFPSLPRGVDRKLKSLFDNRRLSGNPPDPIDSYEKDLKMFKDKEFLARARSWQKDPKWVEDGKFILRGAVDDLLSYQDKIVVLDYKTKGREPQLSEGAPGYYRRQLNLYNLILEKNGYRTADFSILLYYYPRKFDERSMLDLGTHVEEVEKDLQSAEQLVRDAVSTLNQNIPEHSEDCEYKNWCPKIQG